MKAFVGDYSCKLDSKGRVMLPSVLKKQMTGGVQDKFILRKDIFVGCLVLYTIEEWDKQVEKLNAKLSSYNKQQAAFKRKFFQDAAEIPIDSNNRILIPRKFNELLDGEKELILIGLPGKIEVWPKSAHEKEDMDDDTFAGLAEKLMDGNDDDLI